MYVVGMSFWRAFIAHRGSLLLLVFSCNIFIWDFSLVPFVTHFYMKLLLLNFEKEA